MASLLSKPAMRDQRSRSAVRPRPFDLGDEPAYRSWRREKLRSYPATAAALTVAIADPGAPTAAELEAVASLCRKANMAIYATRSAIGEAGVLALARRLGLARLDRPLLTAQDGVTRIEVAAAGSRAAYLPYSNRALGWHTDGYYNTGDAAVAAFVLHCERGAARGGENAFLDPEIVYIRLRDEEPRLIEALMQPDAMTIPANIEAGKVLRPARTGPVFSVRDGALQMRYTARPRHVVWSGEPRLAEALARIAALLEDDAAPIIRHRLAPGQGIVANNVLHKRSGFTDRPTAGRRRLVYRARFLDRVG